MSAPCAPACAAPMVWALAAPAAARISRRAGCLSGPLPRRRLPLRAEFLQGRLVGALDVLTTGRASWRSVVPRRVRAARTTLPTLYRTRTADEPGDPVAGVFEGVERPIQEPIGQSTGRMCRVVARDPGPRPVGQRGRRTRTRRGWARGWPGTRGCSCAACGPGRLALLRRAGRALEDAPDEPGPGGDVEPERGQRRARTGRHCARPRPAGCPGAPTAGTARSRSPG